MSNELAEEKAKLLGSLLLFTQVFYKLRTKRDFNLSNPVGRESHYITVARELTRAFKLESIYLNINIPPGFGKSEMCIHFIAWTLAHYPDSQYMYISAAQSLATEHTSTIKQIIEMPYYKRLFGLELRDDSSAKDSFKTLQGGSIKAFGSAGAIVGQNAGLPYQNRFSGCILMDDMHKPDEVFSDTVREGVLRNYQQTIRPRRRGDNIPIIHIGQRLHEADFSNFLISGKDGAQFKSVILKELDNNDNPLAPEIRSQAELIKIRNYNPYVYWSQHQQEPQPAGGSVFKPEWFPLLDVQPKILSTFITGDTAETDKNYNDASVFSFWGIYRIMQFDQETDLFGLHWLDCWEVWVEAKDLKKTFIEFYTECLRFPVQPNIVAIEKKSTGVTLLSTLSELSGIHLIDIQRTKASGNKAARYQEMQPYVAAKRITFTAGANHAEKCIEHMRKITLNQTHVRDDIADTAYDAVKKALIEKSILNLSKTKECRPPLPLGDNLSAIHSAREIAYGRRI